MANDHRLGRLAAILRAAIDSGVAGALSGAVGGAREAALGAAGGALVGAAAEARRRLAPAPDEIVASINDDETRSASMRVQAIGERVVALESFVERFAGELHDEQAARTRARIAEVGRTVLEMIAQGHATPEDFDAPTQREAIVEAIRFALDALTPDAVSVVARLATRPVDHFFRGTCRVVVDLDAEELGALRDVIGAAARALPSFLACIKVPSGDEVRQMTIKVSSGYPLHDDEARQMAATLLNVRRANLDVLELGEWSPFTEPMRGVEWKLIDVPVETTFVPGSPVFALLIAHRLATAPERKTLPDTTSTVFLRMPITTILDLHFVMTGERLLDPRKVEDREP